MKKTLVAASSVISQVIGKVNVHTKSMKSTKTISRKQLSRESKRVKLKVNISNNLARRDLRRMTVKTC
jgi:hypothetical protein